MTTAVTLAVYLLTLAPEVTLEFSGIFATGAKYAGVPHPPGFPVWTLYAWLFTVLLPFSNIAWRVAVSSAVAAALACGLVALMVSRGGVQMLSGILGLRRCEPRAERWIRAVAGFVAGMGLGLDRAFWSQAVIVESWALGGLLLAAALCLLMRWTNRPQRMRYFYAALFVYALALGANAGLIIAAPGLQLLVLLANRALGRNICLLTALLVGASLGACGLGVLPPSVEAVTQVPSLWLVYSLLAIIEFVAGALLGVKLRRLMTGWKPVLPGMVSLALGLSFYLYLPVASMTNPPLNWGYARTAEGFVHLVSRGQYEAPYPTHRLDRFAQQLGFYGMAAARDVGAPYLAAALVPLWFLRRIASEARSWLVGLFGVFVCLSAFLLAILNPTLDRGSWDLAEAYYVWSHLALLLWAGYGLVLLGAVLTRSRVTACA
jgi:hypothetical protein